MSRRPGPQRPDRISSHGTNADLNNVIQGQEVSNIYGTFFVADSVIEHSRHHGARSIGECSSLDMKAASIFAKSPGMEDMDGKDGLFLDVETTGLAGGTAIRSAGSGRGGVDIAAPIRVWRHRAGEIGGEGDRHETRFD